MTATSTRVTCPEGPDGDPYARLLGDRLRRVRQQQGQSLHDVERRSEGRFKASVVGAYERGERSVSISRLHALAGFYGIPVAELLSRPTSSSRAPTSELEVVIDLAALERQRAHQPTLSRYVQAIRARRGDHHGEVLSVRASDLATLAAVLDVSPDQLRDDLSASGLLH